MNGLDGLYDYGSMGGGANRFECGPAGPKWNSTQDV